MKYSGPYMGVGKFSQGVVSNIGDELARNNKLLLVCLQRGNSVPGKVYVCIQWNWYATDAIFTQTFVV